MTAFAPLSYIKMSAGDVMLASRIWNPGGFSPSFSLLPPFLQP